MAVRLGNPYRALEKSIGYRFRRRRWLEAALTHRSYRSENPSVEVDNQRLEFLGDAVLGFLTAAYLHEHFQECREGDLTAFRSRTNSGRAFAEIAGAIDLGAYMRMGRGEEKCGGRRRESTLADAFEAVVGAVYCDGGVSGAQRVFKRLLMPLLVALDGDVWVDNPKGKLQEVSQRRWRSAPQYKVVRRDGPPHASIFTVEAIVGGRVRGTGKGPSKQDAESDAALAALRRIGGDSRSRPRSG
ncbi:MAG: ribonuclease III [Lentisphaerae bacterium]|nr:ribonuclease III [Lentisphaerota bacterium]